MGYRLNTYVHAVRLDDKGNQTDTGFFGPDDDLSKPENAWVAGAITNPDVWDGPSPFRAGPPPEQGQDEPPGPPPGPPPPGRYDGLKLGALRAAAHGRGLATSGNKPILVARLTAADQAADPSA